VYAVHADPSQLWSLHDHACVFTLMLRRFLQILDCEAKVFAFIDVEVGFMLDMTDDRGSL